MRTVDIYLGRQLLIGTSVALLALLAIDGVIDFLDEIEKVDQYYSLSNMLFNSLLEIIISAYQLLPIAVLLGCVISLGNLAVNAEFLALRACGYARIQLSSSILLVGSLLMAVSFIYGEVVVPAAKIKQYQNKYCCEEVSHFFEANKKYWFHEANYFVNFKESLDNDIYRQVEVFELDKNYQLVQYIEANQAAAMPAEELWVLEDANVYSFTQPNTVAVERWERWELPTAVSTLTEEMPELLKQDYMNLLQLYDYIGFLDANTLHSKSYELAFWTRFSAMLSILVMILLATPWIFAAHQRATMGKRFFIGVLIGLAYLIASQVFSNFSITYAFPVWFGVFLPVILFSAIGLFLLRMVR